VPSPYLNPCIDSWSKTNAMPITKAIWTKLVSSTRVLTYFYIELTGLFNADLDRLQSKLKLNLDRTKIEINELLEEKYNSDYKVYLNKCEKYQKQIDYLNEQISLINGELKQKVSHLDFIE
jgi:hypothetical protein